MTFAQAAQNIAADRHIANLTTRIARAWNVNDNETLDALKPQLAAAMAKRSEAQQI